MMAPASGVVAYACHPSAVPDSVLALAARLQFRPAPDRELTDWPAPSLETNARISSLAEVVDSGGLSRVGMGPACRFTQTKRSATGPAEGGDVDFVGVGAGV